MTNKPDRGGVGKGRTRETRDKLISAVRSMFAWIGPKARRMRLIEVLEQHYIPLQSLSKKTLPRYLCEVRRFDRLMGSPRLMDITPDTFVEFRQRCLAEDFKPSSIEGSVKIVKALLRFAHECGWIKEMPRTGKPLRIDAPIPDPCTLEEIEALYRFADHAAWPARGDIAPADWWRSFLVCELWMGLRIWDLLHKFTWTDIEDDHVHFRASKTGRLHVFPRCPVFDAHLKLVEGWDENYVLGWMKPGAAAQRVREQMAFLCEEAGIRRVTPQQLREACVTNWLITGEAAGRVIHGAGLTVAERHYPGKLIILNEAAPRFRWPEPMTHILPAELRVADEGAA